MVEANPYEAPESTQDCAVDNKVSILLLISCIVFFLLNLLLSIILAPITEGGSDYIIGAVAGDVLIIPFIIIGLFQVSAKFRNKKSRIKIFLFTTLIVIFSHAGSIMAITESLTKTGQYHQVSLFSQAMQEEINSNK